MKVNISDITKVNGASLDIEFHDTLSGLDAVTDDFVFEKPVFFQGRMVNNSGVLSLTGKLQAEYATKCYRCLADLTGKVDCDLKEEFVDREKDGGGEAYTYEGNTIELDKVLQDNILLSLPIRQICSKNCKGLCGKCGINLNAQACDCKSETADSRMEVLKNFFNN